MDKFRDPVDTVIEAEKELSGVLDVLEALPGVVCTQASKAVNAARCAKKIGEVRSNLLARLTALEATFRELQAQGGNDASISL